MHDGFPEGRVYAVVPEIWQACDFCGGPHVDAMEGVTSFFHNRTDGNHGVVEERCVLPVSVGEEAAGEAGTAWCITFAMTS